MTNKKQTKKALFSSLVALVLCFAMLLGTTFAWFTDNASTSVNKIQAGTLDVQLLDEEGNSLEGETLTWQKAEGHEDETVLWEPGVTYNLQSVVIKNAGNLALKYKIVITGINGDAELNNAIEWTISSGENGAEVDLDQEFSLAAGESSDAITISGHMKEDAGNEYQGLSIDGIAITVYATQDTVEYDSTTNQYDADAEYRIPDVWDGTVGTMPEEVDGVYEIYTGRELAALAASVIGGNTYEGKTIKLMKDLDLNYKKWTPIGIYCTTKTSGTLLHKTFNGTFDGQGHTISNMITTDMWGTDEYIIKGAPALFGATGDGATFKNFTMKNSLVYGNNAWSYAAVVAGSHTAGSVTFENVHIDGAVISGTRYVGGFLGIVGRTGGSDPHAIFTDCSMKDVEMYYVHGNDNSSNVYGDIGQADGYCVGLKNVTETNVTVVDEKATTPNSADWKYYYYKDLLGNM